MRRILVIRSGSLKYLLPALSRLQESFPQSRIDVLTDPGISQTLSQNPFVDEVILYRNLCTFFRHQLRELWSQKYDLKVALVTGDEEGRYHKFRLLIHLMAPLARPLVYDEKGESYPWGLATWRAEVGWVVGRGGQIFLKVAKSATLVVFLMLLLPLILIKNAFEFLLYSIRSRPAIQSRLSKEGEIRFHAYGVSVDVEAEFKQDVEPRLYYTGQVFQNLEENGVCFSPFLEIGAHRAVRSLLLTHTRETQGFAADISFHSLESAFFWKEYLGLSGSPTLICCDAYELPFRNNSFPFLFCFQTLHHFPDPRPILKEIYRVLSPGGYFYFDEEPVKRFLSLNLFRTGRQKDFSRLERVLADLGLLRYIAEAYWGSRVETEWGIVENQSISLGQWEEMLAIFDSGESGFDLVCGGHAIKDLLEMLTDSITSKRITARLFGASLKGLHQARKEGAHIYAASQFMDLLGCPNCWSTQPAQGMKDRPPLALEGDSLRCLTCGKRYEAKSGVWILFSDKGDEVVQQLIAK